jgi:hypothetical protein
MSCDRPTNQYQNPDIRLPVNPLQQIEALYAAYYFHPAYQQIIGLGQPAVRSLLREAERLSGHWFWTLKLIAWDDLVPAGDFPQGRFCDRGKTVSEGHQYV